MFRSLLKWRNNGLPNHNKGPNEPSWHGPNKPNSRPHKPNSSPNEPNSRPCEPKRRWPKNHIR